MTYRQRLTGWGWIGACLAVGAPVLLGLVIGDWAGNLNNRYFVPRFPAGLAGLLGVATTVGWIMLLVGREYYPFGGREPRPVSMPDAGNGFADPVE